MSQNSRALLRALAEDIFALFCLLSAFAALALILVALEGYN
jgi:hypothetical protein